LGSSVRSDSSARAMMMEALWIHPMQPRSSDHLLLLLPVMARGGVASGGLGFLLAMRRCELDRETRAVTRTVEEEGGWQQSRVGERRATRGLGGQRARGLGGGSVRATIDCCHLKILVEQRDFNTDMWGLIQELDCSQPARNFIML
jgi:hypothetical protein